MRADDSNPAKSTKKLDSSRKSEPTPHVVDSKYQTGGFPVPAVKNIAVKMGFHTGVMGLIPTHN